MVLETGEDLQDVLDKNHDLLGKYVPLANPSSSVSARQANHTDFPCSRQYINKFGHSKISFLPKVLSIAKALPLQVHPNKELSAKLHKENPQQFTDPNHKPEIAVALSEFEAFCGWKPLETIQALFKLEPLQRYLPSNTSPDAISNDTIKHIVRSMLVDSDENIKSVQSSIMEQPASAFPSSQSHIQKVLPRLQEQYTDTDPGNLVALLCMNYLVLQPGESIYIPADGVHAYLAGDIIECMARSNNVLNTGFCPRADRDNIDTFISTLSFSPHKPEEAMLPEQKFERSSNGRTTVFAPPMSEFNMLLTQLDGAQDETVEAIDGPSILIATEGEGTMKAGGAERSTSKHDINEGYVYFVGQGVPLTFKTTQGKKLKVWRAYCE